MTTQDYINTEEFANEQLSKLLISSKIGLYTLLNGRKWVIYVFIAFLPILISWIPRDYLFGSPSAEEAFIDVYIGFFYIFMFTFGTMLISLPVSSDEITDNVIDLYLVRPIRRDVYWTSRWIIVNIGVFLINAGIVTFYWFYFNIADSGLSQIDEGLIEAFSNSQVYFKMLYLVSLATFTYSGLFLLVGSIGNRGFTVGMMLALTETFFVSLLFLSGSEYIPRTHLNNITIDMFGADQFDPSMNTNHSLTTGYTYLLVFGLVFYLIGIWYFRRKEFN